jgi:hypothetical protein
VVDLDIKVGRNKSWYAFYLFIIIHYFGSENLYKLKNGPPHIQFVENLVLVITKGNEILFLNINYCNIWPNSLYVLLNFEWTWTNLPW